MSFLTDYYKEREGLEVYEITGKGFAIYSMKGEECYISEIYVAPLFRRSGVASEMADAVGEIAKENGCKYLTGTVNPSTNNSHKSLLVLLGYGFELLAAKENLIIFKKDL